MLKDSVAEWLERIKQRMELRKIEGQYFLAVRERLVDPPTLAMEKEADNAE